MLSADVLKVNVDTVGCKSGKSLLGALLLVVEGGIKSKLLGDEVELLIRTDGADNCQAFSLGHLANNLTHSTSSGADKDGLALLRLADLVQTSPSGESWHSERSQEQGEVQVVGVVDLSGSCHAVLGHARVLGNGKIRHDEIALCKIRGVALEDLCDGVVCDWLANLESRRIRLDARVSHLAS